MAELIFLLSAYIDIQQAYNVYKEYQVGRGAIFTRHLDVAFGHLRMFPEIGPLFHGNYRRLLVPRFPYGTILAASPVMNANPLALKRLNSRRPRSGPKSTLTGTLHCGNDPLAYYPCYRRKAPNRSFRCHSSASGCGR